MAADVVRAVRPSLLHASSGYRGFDGAITALALGRHFDIPVVYDVRSYLEATWTGNADRAERGEHYRLRHGKELRCMQDADLVFTIAETMRAELAGRGIDQDKIVVIPNAVEPDSFVPAPADQALAAELGLAGKQVLGYISNLGKREGLDFLIEAIAKLSRRRSDVGGLIVGDGPEIEGLRARCVELGVADIVKITGQVPHAEISRYYALIDVFVVPRRDDHAARLVTPLKPFEAMAMERPLLVADLPALIEVTAPGERGLSFRAEDSDSLAMQAETLLDDPALRARLGRNGRDWVLRERTWAANAERYVEAYARLGVHPEEAK
jgi:glycosyltransferase involved in cell wall biosynthesis